ncbi:TonB family protein [uncultured Brevundimonas sp.]|uniref:TonB family protein n=1 Tax=uncultured Brevundimonas sp. TaxID=213418 RepID=UPI0030EF35AE|tara:strand:- start:5705 stop:6442 length:738 start_codon:yes stop_codon:yes gene_type:complete
MMTRTAGTPGLVSPLEFGDRRNPLTPASWAAIGVVALAHVGVGAALYYQRFELPPASVTPTDTPPIEVIMFKPRTPDPVVTPEPPAPNAPLHPTSPATSPTDTIAAAASDKPAVDFNNVINLGRSVPESSPIGTGTVPTVAPTPPSVISHPHWIRQPSGEQLMRAYPQRALRAEVAGTASLTCVVQTSGAVSGCVVTAETPGGYGFGRAAQALSREFRISPRTVDGQAVDGARVNINLRFTLPDS